MIDKITLKAMRVNRGLKLKEVAESMGVTDQTIVRWENFPDKLPITKLVELVEKYGYELDDLDMGEEKNETCKT